MVDHDSYSCEMFLLQSSSGPTLIEALRQPSFLVQVSQKVHLAHVPAIFVTSAIKSGGIALAQTSALSESNASIVCLRSDRERAVSLASDFISSSSCCTSLREVRATSSNSLSWFISSLWRLRSDAARLDASSARALSVEFRAWSLSNA